MHRWFALTVFVAAALLFTVEPLVGRLLLPLAGGTPSVWTTCLLFFQAALLAGYAYAHGLGDRLPIRMQVPVHLCVIALPAIALPIAIHHVDFAAGTNPALALLPTLAKTVGLPFFALATTAPLMQRWFTAVAPGRDPYPLYAASNAGSLLSLMAYPFLLEPALGLSDQGRWWAGGYCVFAGLIVLCSIAAWFAPAAAREPRQPIDRAPHPWGRWLLLSLAPSSLLLGVTTTITTDLTPVPLLWVVPLALYLLTFILAFAGRSIVPHTLAVRGAPVAALAIFFVLLTSSTQPWWAILSIHLLGFFVIALACHGELARLKPPTSGLTRFYLIMSVGGALGGVLNAIVGPIVFRKVGLAEYPLMLGIAIALLPARRAANAPRVDLPESPASSDNRHPEVRRVISESPAPLDDPRSLGVPWDDEFSEAAAGHQRSANFHFRRAATTLAFPLLIGGATIAAVLATRFYDRRDPATAAFLFGIPLILTFLLVGRPVRFAAGLLMLYLAGLFFVGQAGRPLLLERNFFGINKVTTQTNESTQQEVHLLLHGSTVHGRQFWDGDHAINEPLAYYGRSGPVGDAFRALAARDAGVADQKGDGFRVSPSRSIESAGGARPPRTNRDVTSFLPSRPGEKNGDIPGLDRSSPAARGPLPVAVIGLGAGSVAAYAQPGQHFTFYEIDPAVVRIAQDPSLFRFLTDNFPAGENSTIVLGDGRLEIARAADHTYGLIALDAFSSDSIPVHLLTREAIALYRQKLATGGVIVFHISNRYLDLKPVLTAAAGDLGLAVRFRYQNLDTEVTERKGTTSSTWAALANTESDLGPLADRPWKPMPPLPKGFRTWTDDYSNLMSVFIVGGE